MENKQDYHVYDGIIENNNPMPGWWIWLFIGTVIFGGIYWIHYTFGGGESLMQEFQASMKDIQKMQASAPAPEVGEELLAMLGKDATALALGGKVYSEKCAMCHGVELQGLVGPSLVDKYWIHGKGTHKDIYTTVSQGVADKGMPAWGNALQPDEIKAVVAFVFSKKGTNPPNPKAPQGEPVDN